ncbi:MAG: signal peptidase I [Rhodothermaceae bacterium]|nr:signal peptidase I [Rhodothermaceae bacterium]
MSELIPVEDVQSANPPGEEPSPSEAIRPRRRTSWLKVVGIAFVAALLLRTFVFEAYRIPSSSMESSLLVGDYLFVSKLHHGARLPITLGLPFTGLYFREVELPTVRLPGITPVERGEVIVFNYPPEDGPIDRRQHYIKRVAALPGDTLAIVGKEVRVNGTPLPLPPLARQVWVLRLTSDTGFSASGAREALGPDARIDRVGPRVRHVEATAEEAERLRVLDGVESIEPLLRPQGDGSAAFPSNPVYSLDDYGPIIVPERGVTVTLSEANWLLYRTVLVQHEGHRAQRVAGGYEIDGVLTDQYTFAQDYYFVLGDSRDDSADSRTWGFVPHDHLVGKAVLIYFSRDPRAPWWEWRWSRFFRVIR